MKRSCIVLLIITILLAVLSGCDTKIDSKVYFATADEENFYLKAENRQIGAKNKYINSLKELVKGPESDGLFRTIPSSVKVKNVIVENGTAIIDFSSDILTDFSEVTPSSSTEILAIFSIVNTITEFEEIEKVRITVEGMQSGMIDGRSIEDFWGHIGIYDDFERDNQIIIK